MSRPRDPARLLQALDPAFAELEAGLLQSRARAPSTEQRQRMRGALGLAVSSGAGDAQPAEGTGAAREQGSHVPTWPKVLLGGVLALGMIAGLAALRRDSEVEHPGPRAAPVSHARPESAASGPSTASRSEAASSTDPKAAPRSLRPPVNEVERPTAPLRPRRATAAHDAGASLTEELALLRRAKAHAVSAPDRALALIDEHERRFVQGALAQEREVIAIEALLAQGDTTRAEQRAAQYLERNPGSAHARRVRALLSARNGSSADSDTKAVLPAHRSL